MVKEKNDIFAEEDPIIKEYFETLKQLNEDEVFRMILKEQEETERIYRTYIELAKDEGRKLANMETAKKMLDKNKPIEEIEEFTGLSLEEIEELQ